jgi:o-succinylbenzoate synthase
MRVVSVSSRIVRWPMRTRGAARGRKAERTALIVAARDERGATGLGEASPLRGMSPDTLADALAAVARLAEQMPITVDVAMDAAKIADRVAASGWTTRIPRDDGRLPAGRMRDVAIGPTPSARFAIETALLSLFAERRSTTLADLLSAQAAQTMTCAAVADDPADARAAWDRGARCIKIKAGANELTRVAAIAQAVPKARLRVDANRSWKPTEVHAILKAISQLPIDYVEEPCIGTHRMLHEPMPLELALDESLSTLDREELARALASPGLGAIILKPTLLGLTTALELAARARAAGVVPVVSHTLEGPVGSAACCELARAIGGDTPVGLAPHAAISGWRVAVPQLDGLQVRAANAPGLGFPRLDLDTVVAAAPAESR